MTQVIKADDIYLDQYNLASRTIFTPYKIICIQYLNTSKNNPSRKLPLFGQIFKESPSSEKPPLSQKKAIWNLAIWKNWCLGQFYYSRIHVWQNCDSFFLVSISLARELIFFYHKIRTWVDIVSMFFQMTQMFGEKFEFPRAISTTYDFL